MNDELNPVPNSAPNSGPNSAASVLASASDPMSEPGGGGSRLRRAREARGLTVADIAGHLKVGPKRVEAIEAGQWETLLPLPYVRGFVRNYAKLVQIEAAPILAEIDLALGRTADETPRSLQPTRVLEAPFFDRTSSRSRSSHLTRNLLLGATVLIVIGAAVWFAAGPIGTTFDQARGWWVGLRTPATAPEVVPPGDGQPAMIPPSASPPSQGFPPGTVPDREGRVEQALPAPISHPVGTGPNQGAFPALSGSARPPSPASAASSAIIMRFRDESWVQVRQGDGTVLLSQLNKPDTEQVLAGSEPFELVIGNPTAVSLVYRGEPVDLAPYVRQNVARLTLK